MIIQDIVKELIKKGITVTLIEDNEIIGYKIDGFYKSNTIDLFPRDDIFVAKDRYGKESIIRDLDDLIELNFDWWKISRDRGVENWKNPADGWADLMEEKCLVGKETEIVYYEMYKIV